MGREKMILPSSALTLSRAQPVRAYFVFLVSTCFVDLAGVSLFFTGLALRLRTASKAELMFTT